MTDLTTEQQINHDLALFDGWRMARIGTYYYKGQITTPVDTLDYHKDWNLAHSAWIKFVDAPVPIKEMLRYWAYINSLKDCMLTNETPTDFIAYLHKAIQWYNSLKKEHESNL